MPESKIRKSVASRRKREGGGSAAALRAPGSSRRWVPPAFIAAFLLGVAWLVTYYIAGPLVPFMGDLGNWNILIGMGLMASGFIIATLWR